MAAFVISDLYKDFAVNVASGLIGALLLYLATNGVTLTKRIRHSAREHFDEQVLIYRNGTDRDRQKLVYSYMISVAKRYLIANLFWTAQGMLFGINPVEPSVQGFFGFLYMILGFGAAFTFILCLSKLAQLDRIRRKAGEQPAYTA
jgi:hypothetical protein